MLKNFLLAFTAGLISTSVSAQQTIPHFEPCGSHRVLEYYEKIDPTFRDRFEASFQQSQSETLAQKPTGQIYKIPVVFHVIYKTPQQNLPDSVIYSQIEVLNHAFRKTHADTGDLRSVFKPYSADAEIEFYLADIDPDGNPTTGINRVLTPHDNWGDLLGLTMGDYAWLERIKTTQDGGQDPWPTDKYMNIWVADMTDASLGWPFLMGIATPPVNPLPPNWPTGAFPPLKDGVVLQYHIVGNNNPYISNLASLNVGNAGRTAVHEVGHYLGLRHIWGDPTPGMECDPSMDDGIADTPDQAESSQMSSSCPSPSQNTCVSSSPDLPDMWENYMDYSRDNCQRLFTHGQVAHMRSILANQRNVLVSGAGPTKFHAASSKTRNWTIYPQPANEYIVVNFNEPIEKVIIRHITGQVVRVWTANEAAQRKYNVSNLAPGNYLITLQNSAGSYTKPLIINP